MKQKQLGFLNNHFHAFSRIMKRLRIYLDTSVINFLFADDAPEKKEITVEYFKKYVKTNFYDHYVSNVVTDEILRTKDKKHRSELLKVTSDYHLSSLALEPIKEINDLASHYIKSRIIPKKKLDDALHVAVATIHKIDILLSWNYKHLANINKERKILITNMELGYNFTPRLSTPLEVFNE